MKAKKVPTLLFSTLPFLSKVPYLLNAWKTSPLDQYDWVFFLAIPILLAVKHKSLAGLIKWRDQRGAFPLLCAAAAFAFFYFKQINTLQIAMALVIVVATVHMLWGLATAFALMPLLIIAWLGSPSTTYWTEFFFRSHFITIPYSGLILKLLVGALCALYFCLVFKPPRARSVIFWFACAGIGAIMLYRQTPPLHGTPLTPVITLKTGNFLIYQRPINDVDRVFFGDNQADRIVFLADHQPRIELLSVRLTGKPRSVHPAELCLKSGGSRIHSSREITFTLKSGTLACQKILADIAGEDFLIFSWYLGPEYSTGSYLDFRKNWRPNHKWHAYQIITTASDGHGEAERRLWNLLNLILQPIRP